MAFLNMSMHNNLNTPIPNAFIDDYMATANAAYVIVYIFGFRNCYKGRQQLSSEDIARSLNILESDVINAYKYWEKEKLLKIHTSEDGELCIEFLDIPAKGKEIAPRPKERVVLEKRPQYSTEELEIYKNGSPEISELFETAEQTLGKLLSYNDLNILFSFYDWLRLPIEVIKVLLDYCSDNEHRNIRYIEKCAIDWAENNIRTAEDAHSYIKTFNNDYREILKAFGHSGRNATPAEIKYMQKWINDYQMPIEIILEACDKTIMAIGKPKFSYTDKILTEWSEKNIKTIEEIQKSENEFYKSKQVESKPEKKQPVKKNRFVNFNQRTLDYSAIEKREREFLEKTVEGN